MHMRGPQMGHDPNVGNHLVRACCSAMPTGRQQASGFKPRTFEQGVEQTMRQSPDRGKEVPCVLVSECVLRCFPLPSTPLVDKDTVLDRPYWRERERERD